MTSTDRATSVAAATVVALAGAAWIVIVRSPMPPASEWSLAGLQLWVPMMAGMMLPTALPAVVSRARSANARVAIRFAVAYACVWGVVVVAAAPLYGRSSEAVAGALFVVAALYELSPVARAARCRCRAGGDSGSAYAVSCIVSSGAVMAAWFALASMRPAVAAAVTLLVLVRRVRPVGHLDVVVPLVLAAIGVVVLATV
jgi:hypothetical protein